MNVNERRQQITDMLRTEQSMSVNSIIDKFNYTPATIRRDLDFLEKASVIKRSRGMAHIIPSATIIHYNVRAGIHNEEKMWITQKALEFIEEGDSIILDSGTTTLMLAEQLVRFNHLNIMTNSPTITSVFAESQSSVIVSGGVLLKPQISLVGPDTEAFFNRVEGKVLFLGSSGVRLSAGLTVSSPIESSTKQAMVRAAKKVVALVDSSKFSTACAYICAQFSDIDYLITDKPLADAEAAEAIQRQGTKIIIADASTVR